MSWEFQDGGGFLFAIVAGSALAAVCGYLYAGAAILVGGASIKKATNGQALLGCILFHLLFIVAPSAGKNLFGDAAIGEYFRVFISYGVIALALVMYAWGDYKKKKN